ncbi:hypothetical protein ACIBJE_25685 [Micromonospora sp. NPDC050187]
MFRWIMAELTGPGKLRFPRGVVVPRIHGGPMAEIPLLHRARLS